MATLHELTEDALIDILSTPRNSLVKQFQKLFEMDGVKAKFSSGALTAIARKALERESGARGLRAIMEEAMLDVMYELPSKTGVKEIAVNEEVITKGEHPLIVYENEEKEVEVAGA